MALAVVYAWYMTAWAANWLGPDRRPVRILLVGLKFASLLMSVAIADAFDGRAWLFVTGYLLLQIGRSAFLIVALRGRAQGEHFVNDLVWELLTGGLWVAGALADGDARLVLWALAVLATQGGVWTLHWLPGRGRRIDIEHTEIAGGHLVERFRLFFIIALGGDRIDDGQRVHQRAVRDRATARAGDRLHGYRRALVVLLPARRGDRRRDRRDRRGRGRRRVVGTWTLTLIVLALIGIAVGDELAIAHPGDDTTLGFTILTFGGPALFLLAQVFFLRAALGYVPRSRPLGLAALAILAVAAAALTLIVGIAASSAVLVAVAIADTVSEGDQAPTAAIDDTPWLTQD